MHAAAPCTGLKVVDFGMGMASALVTKFLAEAGATIQRYEPASGDPFHGVYPAYGAWRRGAEAEVRPTDAASIDAILAEADICIVGGEDFPDLPRPPEAAELARRHPRLIVVEICGYPAFSDHAGEPACDLLIQAGSGLCFEQLSGRAVLMSFEPSSYGAALQALIGLYAALYEREGSNRGQVVSASLYEGALVWASSLWVEVERPNRATQAVMPLTPRHLIFECADGRFIQFVFGSIGAKGRLYRILEIDDPDVGIDDSGAPKPTDPPEKYFGDIDFLAPFVRKWRSADLLQALWDAGIAAEPVMEPGECWDMEQVILNKIIARDEDGSSHVGHPVAARSGATAAPRPPRTGKGPLSGIRVIDFGAFVAGPYCTTILADLGADVIKVEPLRGEIVRGVFRIFVSANRGKRAIAIDLKKPEGIQLAHELCAKADIILNNFRAGVSERLGLDPVSLLRRKPDLLVFEGPGYGDSGPLAQRAGFDMVFQALCGHEFRLGGGAGHVPGWNRTSMIDYAAGLLGAVALIEYLFHRARTGSGTALTLPLINVGLFLLSELIRQPDGHFLGAPPLNARLTGYHPAEQFYETADGWIAVAARDERMAQALADAMGIAGLRQKPRAEWGEAEGEAIAAAIRGEESDALLRRLKAAGVWTQRCKSGAENGTLRDPRLEEAGVVIETEHPSLGRIRQLGSMIHLSRSASVSRKRPPGVGEHSRQILGDYGYSEREIEAMLENGTIA